MRDQPNNKRSTSGAKPSKLDRPSDLVKTWTVLEALSPRTFTQREDLVDGDAGSVAALSEHRLPWDPPERPRPDCKLYYHIVLGEIRMDVAMTKLVQAFGEDEELPRHERSKAVIASVLVDAHGTVADGESTGWAIAVNLRENCPSHEWI